ncbi:MAG: HypC/HybG/HupF family hydrogenase formation chaperone [Candidatus Omnitrophota bacterium]
MCLGIPMKLISIEKDFATAEVENIKRRVNIRMLANAKIGDYVLIHAGFAIQKIDPIEAKKTIKLIKDIT